MTAALRRHWTRQPRGAVGGRRPPTRVWVDVHDGGLGGTAVDRGRLHKTFKAMLRSAELPDIRYHDRRHTAVTLLLAQGADPRIIMETLGHSQITLTLNTHADVMPGVAGRGDRLALGVRRC